MTDASLREWVRKAQVTYEASPHLEMHRDEAAHVGFDLVLHSKRPDACTGDPACEACDRSVEKLLELLQSCLPPGARHELEPFDHSFHLRPETDFAPELQVSVSVLHPTGTFTESDDNDRTLVDRVLHSLEQLGVQSRVWTQARQ